VTTAVETIRGHRLDWPRIADLARSRRNRDMKTKTKIKAGGLNVSGL